MPDVLRTITLAADEKLWIFDTDRAGMQDLKRNPGRWIRDHVSQCAGSRTDDYVFLHSSNPTGFNRFVMMGVCGTSFIYLDGIEGDLLDAINEIIAEEGPLPWLTSLRDRLALRMERTFAARAGARGARALALTWNNVDAEILQRVDPAMAKIEFFFFEEEQKGFIHFELGGDSNFNQDFVDLVSDDSAGYLDWLMGNRNPLIARQAFKVPMGGVPQPVAMNSFQLQLGTNSNGTPRDLQLVSENPERLNCLDPCIETACDSNFVSIVSGTLGNGNLVGQVEIGLDKAYCKHKLTGEPCP